MTNPADTGAREKISLINRLARYDSLADADLAAIEALPVLVRTVAKGEDMVREGAAPNSSILLISGFASRYHILSDGRRQIMALHVDGDFVDLHCFLLKTMDHSVAAATNCEIALVAHADLQRITETMPHVTRLFWLSTVIDAAIHREWIVGMGRRTAAGNLAHLFCELYTRLAAAGRADAFQFPLPVTQTDIADALGLSLVQVNRTLRELREMELARWRNGTVVIQNWAALVALAEFDATYLHLERRPR